LTQIRLSGLRRLVIPLGLSLAAHALFVAFVWLAPSPSHENAADAPASPTNSIGVCFDQGRADSKLVERPRIGAGLPDEYDPTLVWEKNGIDVHVGSFPAAPSNAGANGSPGDNGSSVGQGGTAAPSIIGAPAHARRVTYLIDRSLSMGASGALERAKDELVASVCALPPNARFRVFVYNLSAQPLLTGDWATPDVVTLGVVKSRLNDLSASGGTDHVGALRRAMLTRPDVLFWVTDADELTDAAVREVTRLNVAGTRLHVVELAAGRADGRGLLKQLSENNGGTYRRVSPTGGRSVTSTRSP
jgi:hypothetical protein